MNRLWIFFLISTFFWQASCERKQVANKSRFTKEQQLYMGAENTIRTEPTETYSYVPESTVYFGFNESQLNPEAQQKLREFYSEVIRKEPQSIFFVEGNTDTSGTQEYNMILSEKRANEVIRYLVYLGAPSSQFSVLARGELNPIADDTRNPELNRRVIVYRKTKN